MPGEAVVVGAGICHISLFAARGAKIIAGFRGGAVNATGASLLTTSCVNGGESGIRTHGTLLRFTSLAKKRFRPLSHLTV